MGTSRGSTTRSPPRPPTPRALPSSAGTHRPPMPPLLCSWGLSQAVLSPRGHRAPRRRRSPSSSSSTRTRWCSRSASTRASSRVRWVSSMTRRLLLILLLGALFGCASADLPKRTQLQIREFQTRSYETSDVKLVMKAVANVMQDDGYMINDANAELGLITGRKETDIESVGGRVWRTLFFMYGATSGKTAIIEATGNVSAFGSQTKVRMNFHLKVLN